MKRAFVGVFNMGHTKSDGSGSLAAAVASDGHLFGKGLHVFTVNSTISTIRTNQGGSDV